MLALVLCVSMVSEAKLVLSSLCSDSMVLQQNSDARIWGKASAGAQVTVTPSWDGKAYRCKAGADGKWEVEIKTPKGGYKAYDIMVKGDGSSVKINDVLVGEVWLASGQSNMEMPMKGFFNSPIEGAEDYICAAPATEKIRMFTVPIKQSHEPLDEVESSWKGAQSSTVPQMSATAFFFAHKLNQVLDMPVGIIACAYGGARIESWTPKEILETYPDEDLSIEKVEATNHYVRPYMAYNAMLCPVMGYTIKGFIWYQGCSNVGKHEQFVERMQNMIGHWRSCWGDKDAALPFYMVEIAPYRYVPQTPVSYASELRQVQHEAARVIPNCGIVVTNDLVMSYEKDNIHPTKKREIGDRLARLALNRDYGMTSIACYSPEATNCVRLSNSELGVELSNCPEGLNRNQEIQGLEVAGYDCIFYPVTFAYFEYSKILRVRSEFVPYPMYVRYGWGDFNPGNLKNCEGLPVSPFSFWVQ